MVSHHRHRRVDDDDPATYEEDVAQLSLAGERLREVAEQVDVAQQEAIDAAVKRSVAEADQRARTVSRRAYWTAAAVAMVLAIAVSLPFALVGFYTGQAANERSAALQAGSAASSEVTTARAASLVVVRRDFSNANSALIAAGLTPVPDPGPAASAYQVAIATGEALGTLRAAGELQKRGVSLPGVDAPDPASPEFPDLRFFPAPR